jgi:Flp pilus assembly protein TadD, contains TPR repeats
LAQRRRVVIRASESGKQMKSSVLSSSAKFKPWWHFTALAACALALAGCATAPVQTAPKAIVATPQPLARIVVATPDAEHDVLAQVLAGEMALTRADLPTAAGFYAQAMTLSSDPKVAARAAELALAIHDDTAAARALDKWQQLGAKPAALARARAELALDRGDGALAQTELERLLASGDKNAWRQFGRVLVGARDRAQAARMLEALATPQRLPADVQAWLAMSELGAKLGRNAYAMRIAEAAMTRFRSPESYAWAAHMKLSQGDSAGARALLHQAISKAPTDARLRLAYASLLGQAGDYPAAARTLERGPQNAEIYALRAALAAQNKDDKTLAALYQHLQNAAPEVRERSTYLLGQLAEMQHRNAEALAWYAQVGDDDPHAFDADLRSALILHTQGRTADAHQLLEQLELSYLEQPAQLRQAYQLDAELYLREQQYPQAEAAFGRALQVAPDDPALLYGRGLAYAQAGNIDMAVRDFRRLLEIKPGDVNASNALGFTLADANRDLPEAERLIQVARTAMPKDPAIADSWGWLQYRLGHLDQAVQTLRAAWASRKDPDVGVHLGEVLLKQGNAHDAQEVFDEVRKIDPHNATLQETLKRLHP